MQNLEIERKFLIKNLPDLSKIIPIIYERYYIFQNNKIEIRIQRKADKYEFERKEETSELSRKGQIFEISEDEFNYFKSLTSISIQRDSYLLSQNPKVSIKIYRGRHKGLVRAEIEFDNEEDANNFVPFDWLGEEITNSPLGRDGKLIKLSENDFKILIQNAI